MGYAFFPLLSVVPFLRPGECVRALGPFLSHEVMMIGCLALGSATILLYLTVQSLAGSPITVRVTGVVAATVPTEAVQFRLRSAYEAAERPAKWTRSGAKKSLMDNDKIQRYVALTAWPGVRRAGAGGAEARTAPVRL